MGWRGLAATLPHQSGWLPSLPGGDCRPVRARHPCDSPVSRLLSRPGVSPEWRPFPAVKVFLPLRPAAAQEAASHLLRLFSLSTAWRQLSANKWCYPLHCSQAIHSTCSVRCSGGWAGKRPGGGSEAGQPAVGDFCRRVASWAAARIGHNKTRPPPFMGWRGPCAACRIGLASCPACPAATTAPSGPGTRTRLRFPGASHVSGVSP